MSLDDFASFEGLLGQKTIRVNGLHWSRVRPLFYRPLVPFREFVPGSLGAPRAAFLGGFQHAVPGGAHANSSLDMLMFQDAKSYTLNALDYNRKRQVKRAAKEFTIRRISDVAEFRTHAYPVYVSFYERTGYQYGSQRRHRDFFENWANRLFEIPSLLVLGGYRQQKLGGVSLSMLIGDTVFYATFFCDTESLRLFLSDLMLHFVREASAESPGVKQIFSGMHKGGNGLDDFYLHRGCKIVRKPSLLKMNPLASLALKFLLPNQYGKLCRGHTPYESEPEGKSSVSDSAQSEVVVSDS